MNVENAIHELKDEVESLKDELAEEKEKRRELERENEQQERRIQALLTHVRENAIHADGVEDLANAAHARISGADDDPDDRTDETDPAAPPISQIVSLPDHIAEAELSRNQRRARRFFRDVRDYTTPTGTGRRITGGEMRRVLAALEPDDSETTVESKTVERVMSLIRSGTRDVAEVKKDGADRILFIPNDWADQARERAPDDAPDAAGAVVR